ncbi:MAG: hypothetical protein IJD14_01465 [Christensenellaceae bacterium]|nr:hypothetical protein [Christensenellaceae bacterium]
MRAVRSYEDSVHFTGRIWIITAAALMILFPSAVCMYFNAWPPIQGVLKGLLGVVPIFWTVGIIEVFTYTPMLGAAGTYLGFVTGNLTNLKVPCALNAMSNAGVKSGTEEAEIISGISIAVSSLVTTVIIILGVILIVPLTPVLNNPVLAPAFDNILPALFGGLAVVYVSKNWKIAIVPLIIMVALFICVPSLAGSVGVLVPVGALIAILTARILYKKGVV